MEKIAFKFIRKLEAAKLVGLILIGKDGSDEVKVGVHGSPEQVGVLLGYCTQAFEKYFHGDDYKKFLDGYVRGRGE